MPDDTLPQRRATIMSIDVAGYSELTEADAAHMAVEIAALRRKIESLAERRKFSTSRSSRGKALTMSTPVCGDMTICRPPSGR